MKYAILCGTVYGANYVPALQAEDSPIRLGGIVSRGSERSVQMARALGVPHSTSLSEVSDKQADVVIVAVSGDAGVSLSKEALRRGFDVLAEHPWEPEHVSELTALAQETGRAFHINGHWADQENALAFIHGCHAAAQSSSAVFANLITNPRTLYSGLDLLHRAIGATDLDSFVRIDPITDNPPFVLMQGVAGLTQVTIQYQTYTSLVDDGTAALANHHFVIGYPHGHLTLAETSSPALWVPDMTQLYTAGSQGQAQPSATFFPQDTAPTVGAFNHEHRVAANRFALERILGHAATGDCPPEQSAEHHQSVANTWRCLMNLGGEISYVGG